MWLIRIWRIVSEPVEKVTGWMDGAGDEPVWRKPHTHRCGGCGLERPVDVFEAVDTWVGGKFSLLVRCDECRLVKRSNAPFDAKGKP